MLQKHSRWITRFLLLFFAGMLFSTTYAQEDSVLVIPFIEQLNSELPAEAELLLDAAAKIVAEMGIEVRYERADEDDPLLSSEQPYLWFVGDSGFWFFIKQPAITLTDPILLDSFGMTTFRYPCDTCTDDSDFIVQELAGYLLYLSGEYDDAETILTPLLNRGTSDGRSARDIYFVLGNINILQNDYETATDYFRTFTDRLGIASGNINLAWLELQLGNEDIAFDRINTWLDDIDVETDMGVYIGSLVARARLYALVFDYDSAIADMNTAIEIAETDDNLYQLARLYTIRGEIIFLIYEWDRVEDNFDMAIEIAPTYAPAYFQRGILFYTVARREDAQADFEMYLELTPDGIYAEQATSYIESIEIELEALGN